MDGVISTRKLTQEELDGYGRSYFVNGILQYIETGKTARFITRLKKNRLITIKKEVAGEWTFSASGLLSSYTRHFSVLVKFIEDIYDSGANIMVLDGEINVDCIRPVADVDDEEQ